MNFAAGSALALSSLVLSAMPLAVSATDGTIYFSGQIVLSTVAPDQAATPILDRVSPRRSMALQPLPLEAEEGLLDYFAEYMHGQGIARRQLTLQASAYE